MTETAHHSVSERAYSVLKKLIINLDLPPGKKITENEIAEGFKVSRTPVREAFLRLSQEGLIVVYPQRGSFVSLIDLDHVEEAKFMRKHLEPAAAKYASSIEFPRKQLEELEKNLNDQETCVEEENYKKLFDLDGEFHRIIFTGCHKERTWKSLQQMMINLDRIRMLSLASHYNWQIILEQHRKVVQSIRSKNPNQAEQVMLEHMKLVDVDIGDLVQRYPDYFKRRAG